MPPDQLALVLALVSVLGLVVGLVRTWSVARRTIDVEIFTSVMVRLLNAHNLARAGKLLAAARPSAYAAMFEPALEAAKAFPAGTPASRTLPELERLFAHQREVQLAEVGDAGPGLVQLALSLGPLVPAFRDDLPLGWLGGLALAGVLVWAYGARARAQIRGVTLERAEPLLRACAAAVEQASGPPPVPEPPATRARELVAYRDGARVAAAPLRGDSAVKIGRVASAHLRLNDDAVSRMHAMLECEGQSFKLIDLGSAQGTRVNGDTISARSLTASDTVTIGPFTLRIEGGTSRDDDDPPAPEVPVQEVPAPLESPSGPAPGTTGAPAPAGCPRCGDAEPERYEPVHVVLQDPRQIVASLGQRTLGPLRLEMCRGCGRIELFAVDPQRLPRPEPAGGVLADRRP